MEDENQLIRVVLNDKLVGGGETTIIFTCMVTIPEMRFIYGISRRDGEIQISYFYPQLAVFDENGWNTKPLNDKIDGRYLRISNYTMTITAPSEYELACNGVELTKETDGNQTTRVFQADNVREAVLIAHNNYARMERTVGSTRIIGYFNANDTLDDMEKVMEDAAFSMEFFNNAYMPYPYETLIITDAGWGRSSISGMEYSGLFTAIVDVSSGPTGENIEKIDNTNTIYHEMAHQWFYCLVGNNENNEAWLDESFAVFSSTLCMEAAGNENAASNWELCSIMADSDVVSDLAVNISIDDYRAFNLYYGKGAQFLKDLMDAIGKDEFISILSEYVKMYAFGIATTQGFLTILREHSPVDVECIIDEYIAA
jgi:aminopeptidase N